MEQGHSWEAKRFSTATQEIPRFLCNPNVLPCPREASIFSTPVTWNAPFVTCRSNLRTLWNRPLFEKVTDFQLLKKFLSFYRVCKEYRFLSMSWASLIQFTSSCFIIIVIIIIVIITLKPVPLEWYFFPYSYRSFDHFCMPSCVLHAKPILFPPHLVPSSSHMISRFGYFDNLCIKRDEMCGSCDRRDKQETPYFLCIVRQKQPNSGLRGLIVEVSKPHTDTTTFIRTPLDQWSARRRDLYLTSHNTHKRQISVLQTGFENAIPANEWPPTYALNGASSSI